MNSAFGPRGGRRHAGIDIGSPRAQQVAAAADVVTVHLALTPETQKLCGEKFFAALRPGAIFINTSRGGIVDAAALRKAIQEKGIRAGLDVFAKEPATAAKVIATNRQSNLANSTAATRQNSRITGRIENSM